MRSEYVANEGIIYVYDSFDKTAAPIITIGRFYLNVVSKWMLFIRDTGVSDSIAAIWEMIVSPHRRNYIRYPADVIPVDAQPLIDLYSERHPDGGVVLAAIAA